MPFRAIGLPFILVCLISLVNSAGAIGADIYSAITPRLYAPNDTNSMYYNLPGTRPRILFDDVTVPFSAPTSRFQVTKVTVKISRATGAPGITVTPYYSLIVPDPTYNGGPNDFSDFPDVAPPTPFWTPEALGPMGALPFTETLLSFGTGSNTLFIVPGSTVSTAPGMHSFAIGLELSSADSRNGWTLAQQANNLDLLWDYVSPTNFAEFTYDTDSTGNFIIGTQYLQVEGQVVSGLDGDANADGLVDLRDLWRLSNNWLAPGAFANGDFNFDGFVDKVDLSIIARNWQATASLSEALSSVGLDGASVPEPTSLCLLFLGILPMFRRR